MALTKTDEFLRSEEEATPRLAVAPTAKARFRRGLLASQSAESGHAEGGLLPAMVRSSIRSCVGSSTCRDAPMSAERTKVLSRAWFAPRPLRYMGRTSPAVSSRSSSKISSMPTSWTTSWSLRNVRAVRPSVRSTSATMSGRTAS